MLPHMAKRFREGGFHLVGSRAQNNLRSHVVQVLFELLDFAFVPGLERMLDDFGEIAIRRHARLTRRGF